MTEETPRIYAACLASYNAGHLHGTWIDADQEAEDIQAEIDDMLEKSPVAGAEEWAIHDSECFPTGAIGEYTPIETVAKYGKAVAEHGDVLRAACSLGLIYYIDQLDDFMDYFIGEYESIKDYVEDYIENHLDIPDHIQSYIDWERVWADIRHGVTYERVGDSVYFFNNR